MKGQLYAAFMERRGRRILAGAGCYWYGVNPRMIMSIPYQEKMDLPVEEIQHLLRRYRIMGARYLTDIRNGLAGGVYVRQKSPYTISSVDRKAKNAVRRSLEKCTLREVEKDELRRQGLQLNLDTMARQKRFDPEFGLERFWRRLVDAAYGSPGVKVMGAFANGALAAYVITLTEDRWVHLLHQFSATRLLGECFPNNALTFGLTKAAMENPSVDVICCGLAGLVEGQGLHQYKLHHGYQFIPYGYAFVLHPAIRCLLANPVSARGIQHAQRFFPGVQLFERIGSVIEGARMTQPRNLVISRREAA
jgi:hypothetical protein